MNLTVNILAYGGETRQTTSGIIGTTHTLAQRPLVLPQDRPPIEGGEFGADRAFQASRPTSRPFVDPTRG